MNLYRSSWRESEQIQIDQKNFLHTLSPESKTTQDVLGTHSFKMITLITLCARVYTVKSIYFKDYRIRHLLGEMIRL